MDDFELDDGWISQIDEFLPQEEEDPYLYVLGLDPGGTTGVAMLRIDPEDDTVRPELVYLHQISDGRYGFKDFFEGSSVRDNVIIVSEQWAERNIKGADREPQYIEGSMHMLWDDDNIEYQKPTQKELVPDEWLKQNNLWTEGKRHQMDALKHAFAYLRNDGHSATVNSLGGRDDTPFAQPGEAQDAQLGDGGAEGDVFDNISEVFRQLGKVTGEASFEQLADALEGKNTGWGKDTREHHGKRRERNGAFAGFGPEGADDGETVLLLDD